MSEEKEQSREKSEFKVCAFMTLPRYENVYCRNQIDQALREVGIPLHTAQGVFYGQCMQRLMKGAIDAGIQIAITIDFDSIFKGQDIIELLRILATRPDIDAVASMQARRGQKFPLMTIKGQKSVEWDGNPLQVSTAHFGLTALRLDKIAALPKPWFWSTPGEGGDWEDESGKIDDDIFFWYRWKEAGNTLYVHPGVRIGHMEEMVACYNDRFEVVHMYPSKWKAMAYELEDYKGEEDEHSACDGQVDEDLAHETGGDGV